MNAFHELNVGRSARVFVDQNGERVEYTSINRAGLIAYINTLAARLGIPPMHSGGGPLRPWL